MKTLLASRVNLVEKSSICSHVLVGRTTLIIVINKTPFISV